MKIAIVGSGYVGLVTGTCLAETGNTVTCIDIDVSKIQKMQKGIIPIYEPGLEQLFKRNISEERLKFTSNLEEGVKDAKVIFLALPTPPNEDGSADLSYVLDVATHLGKIISDYKVIVDKSTVPVGTAEMVYSTISNHCKVQFDVVSNPEFLREGVAVDDFMKPERVVVGTSSSKAKKIMEELFAPFVRQGNPIIFMDERSAELTKYAANAFLATKISFMNEVANLCEKVGANVDSVRAGIGTDSRIGKRFLFPGIGYGGSCFPKDVSALAKIAKNARYEFKILDAVMSVNNKQKNTLFNKIKLFYENNLSNKKFAIWGLSFKPNTDDIREAPALHIIDCLLKEQSKVCAFDPESMNNVKALLGNKISYASNQYDVLKNADALIIATEWSVFRTPDFEKIAKLLKAKVIFDGRNLYETHQMKKLGFTYFSIGREAVSKVEHKIEEENLKI